MEARMAIAESVVSLRHDQEMVGVSSTSASSGVKRDASCVDSEFLTSEAEALCHAQPCAMP